MAKFDAAREKEEDEEKPKLAQKDTKDEKDEKSTDARRSGTVATPAPLVHACACCMLHSGTLAMTKEGSGRVQTRGARPSAGVTRPTAVTAATTADESSPPPC